MKTPEQVYALLVEANPIADMDLLPDVGPQLHVVDTRRPTMQTQEETRTERPAPRRRFLIPALASVVAVVAAIAGLVVLTDGDDESSPAAAPPPPVTAAQNPNAAREAAALARAESFYTALYGGDLETVEALTGTDEADLRMWAFNAVSVAEFPRTLEGCEVVDSANTLFVAIECTVSITDPILVASGITQWVEPWQVFDEGELTWRPIQEPSLATAMAAARDYLIANHSDDYDEVCNPGGYEFGRIISNRGVALTAECAELVLALSEDIAAWIEAGRP